MTQNILPPRLRRLARNGRLADLAVVAFFFALYARRAIYLGPDASWDLRNYHFYVPFALLHGKGATDLYPAMQHSFTNPALDLLPYLLRIALDARPNMLSVILAIPSVLCVALGYRIILTILPPDLRLPRLLAFLAVVIGGTGVALMQPLATAESEAFPAMFTLAALVCILQDRSLPGWRRYAMAGVLAGIGAGFKLTELPYVVALFVVSAVFSRGDVVSPLGRSALFAAGCGVGAALTGGPWWVHLYHDYSNPIFPFYNDLFRSPDYAPVRLTDNQFKPANWLEALFFPFTWAFQVQKRVTEFVNRDARFAVAYVATVLAAVTGGLRFLQGWRPAWTPDHRATGAVMTYLVLGFCLWEGQFSIFRYIVPLEIVVAAPLLVLVRLWRHTTKSWWVPHASLAAIAAIILGTTVTPSTDHGTPTARVVNVKFPVLPAGSLVVLLDGSPMSYVAVFADEHVRFAGANNRIIGPDLPSALRDKVQVAIAQQPAGSLWGIDNPGESPGQADRALAFYHLHKTGACIPIESNLQRYNPIEICPLSRNP